MATPFELMQAIPNGLFDKRSWSPKARDEFAKRLLEEEATRQFNSKSKLQAEHSAQQGAVQKQYLQQAHDLEQQSKDASRGKVLSALKGVARQQVLANWPQGEPMDPDAVSATVANLAGQLAAEYEAADALKASRSARNDLRLAGTEEALGPDIAAGEVAQTKLKRQQAESALADFPLEQKLESAQRKGKLGVANTIAENPVTGMSAVLNAMLMMQRNQQQAPVAQATVAEKLGKAAVETEKAAGLKAENELMNGLGAKPGSPPRLKLVNGTAVPVATPNTADVAPVVKVNQPQPTGLGLPVDESVDEILKKLLQVKGPK